jgi:hypothetical protein
MNKCLQNLVARGALIAVLTACGAGGEDKKSSETGTTAQPMLAALPTLAVPLVASDTAETVNPLPSEAVAVYSDSDFAGASDVLAIGIYVAKDGKLAQLDDNSVRSLKIPPLFLARLCDNADGSGDCWTFGGGDHSTIGSKLDKKASRLEVIKVNTQIKTAADVQAAVSLGGYVQLPTDVYYFDKPIELSISNTRLNGNGSTFVFSDRFKNAVIVQPTKGVVLENFSLDYNPLPFTQGVVTAIADNNFDLNVDEGYSADPRLFIVDKGLELLSLTVTLIC